MSRSAFAQVSIVLLFVVSNEFVDAQKCRTDVNGSGRVLCADVGSLDEVSKEATPAWEEVVIINDKSASFYVAETNPNNLNTIQKLDLSQAGEVVISDHGFKDLSALRSLNITGTQVANFQLDHFHPRSTLQYLDASQNAFTSLIPNSFENLSNLRSVNFSNNNINHVQSSLFQLFSQLKYVNLNFNSLKSYEPGQAPALEHLTISDNLIEVIASNNFDKLPQLKILEITANPLKRIEDRAFQGLTSLKVLNLSYNSLESLTPNVFDGLSRVKLDHLDLSQNDFASISNQPFRFLTLLRNLNISGNSLKSLDSNSFTGLRSLRRLFIYDNDIRQIGENTFADLTNLETLDLSGNSLTTFAPNIFGVALPKLRRLLLNRNNIVALPNNAFTSIPRLDYLSLAGNSHTEFDIQLLAPLKLLKKLDISRNYFENLPSNVLEGFNDLHELYIGHNQLTFLPTTNASFPFLRKVSIEGNPWQCPCIDELLKYFEDRKIDYNQESQYYTGDRPLCVVTPVNVCVRNLRLVQQYGVADRYERIGGSDNND